MATHLKASVATKTVRFAIVGVLVTAIHIVIATTLVSTQSANVAIANCVAFIAATAVSYGINTIWSFSSIVRRRTFSRFATVSAIGLFVATAIPWIIQEIGQNYVVGSLVVATIVPPFTFALHNLWTYSDHASDRE